MIKVCSKCGCCKPLDGFYKNARYADGYQGVCRECQNKRMRELEASGARADVIKKYRQSPKGRETAKRLARDYRERYPEKIAAHSEVSRAVSLGDLVRSPCEICGGTPSHAHHDDYSNPLNVRWLCVKHHTETHRTGGC